MLRMDENVPARQTMSCYFNGGSHKGRKGNFCTIASVISDEYKASFEKSIKTKEEYDEVVVLAQDRNEWKKIVQSVTDKFCKLQEDKVTKQKESRKKAETKAEEKRKENKKFKTLFDSLVE